MSDVLLHAHLGRIATALEEQNRLNAEWIALQKQWHEEGKHTGERIIAIHEQNLERDERHRAEILHIAEEQARKVSAWIEEAHAAYMEKLGSQPVEETDE